jgi:hypothetical protein
MASLTDSLLGGSSTSLVEDAPGHSLTDNLLTSKKDDRSSASTTSASPINPAANRASLVRGLKDILDTGAHGLARGTSAIADKILPEGLAAPIRKSMEDTIATDTAERNAYDQANPKSEGILPTTGEVSRMAGQVVGTLPLTPVKAFQAIKGAMGALPTVAATGQRVAAPIINRLGASAVTGGLAGGEYGALTSSTNEDSLLENTTKGLITGAIAGPAITGAAALGKGALPTLRNMWANVQINKLAQNAGLESSAVKNIIAIAENAGFTPQDAQKALNKLGPNATLMDLASSIQAEGGGIASFGGKPMEIIKGRMEARAQTANSSAHNIMETKLGPKPDIEAEKEAIVKQARADTSADYKSAHSNPTALDVQPTVDYINKQLETAVGPKEAALKQLKGFLYKTVKDANGNDVQVLKHKVSELHEIRQAIDDVVEKKGTPETSYGKNALNAIGDVRGSIDKELKTIPEMASADAKFAAKMDIKNAVDTGYEVLKKNNYNKEEFARLYDNASPEIQAALKKGMRAHIGDLMESASRGELSEAQRLFGKNSANRANFEKAFGQSGSEVLDELQKEAMFRGSEKSVSARSHTAEGQAIQRKYGERNDKSGGLTDIIQGSALDAVTGTPGAATAIMTIKRAGGHIGLKISEGRKERLIEGTADLLSRQGNSRNVGLDVATQVHAVQSKISGKLKLPVVDMPTYLISGPVGETSYSAYKKSGNE